MDKIEKLDWDPSYSVDIPEIDELQKKMFALFNVLIDMKADASEEKDCANMISEINEYCKYYFGKEEEYLKKEGYPDFESHSKEHRQFVKTTINLRREVTEEINNLTYQSIRDLREWLINHIVKSDAQYVPYLRIRKYINDCQSTR